MRWPRLRGRCAAGAPVAVSPSRVSRAIDLATTAAATLSLSSGWSSWSLLLLVGVVGPLFVDVNNAQAAAVVPGLEPSARYPLGTDPRGATCWR